MKANNRGRSYCGGCEPELRMCEMCDNGNMNTKTNEIEHLQSENTQLRKQLDKAVGDVKQSCRTCTHNDTQKCPWTNKTVASTGEKVGVCNAWLWRGLEESE